MTQEEDRYIFAWGTGGLVLGALKVIHTRFYMFYATGTEKFQILLLLPFVVLSTALGYFYLQVPTFSRRFLMTLLSGMVLILTNHLIQAGGQPMMESFGFLWRYTAYYFAFLVLNFPLLLFLMFSKKTNVEQIKTFALWAALAYGAIFSVCDQELAKFLLPYLNQHPIFETGFAHTPWILAIWFAMIFWIVLSLMSSSSRTHAKTD